MIMLENACPKPRLRKSLTRANRRVAAKIKRQVRAAGLDRDCNVCRAWWMIDMDRCDGPLEWAHFGDYKRFKTRGKPAAERHTTMGSLMLCQSHHRAYDSGRLAITALSDRGADGPLEFRRA